MRDVREPGKASGGPGEARVCQIHSGEVQGVKASVPFGACPPRHAGSSLLLGLSQPPAHLTPGQGGGGVGWGGMGRVLGGLPDLGSSWVT